MTWWNVTCFCPFCLDFYCNIFSRKSHTHKQIHTHGARNRWLILCSCFLFVYFVVWLIETLVGWLVGWLVGAPRWFPLLWLISNNMQCIALLHVVLHCLVSHCTVRISFVQCQSVQCSSAVLWSTEESIVYEHYAAHRMLSVIFAHTSPSGIS